MDKTNKTFLIVAISLIIILLVSIIFLQQDDINKKNIKNEIQKAYDNGYVEGYNKGFNAGAKEVQNFIHQQNK